MSQKGWTPFTCIMNMSVAQRTGTQATLLGQNENQVIILNLQDKSELIERGMSEGKFATLFIKELYKSSKSVRLQITQGKNQV